MAPSVRDSCEFCQDTGWRPVGPPDGEPGGDLEDRRVRPCDCAGRKPAAPRTSAVLRDAGVPRKFVETATFEAFADDETSLARAKHVAMKWGDDYPDVRRGLLFSGPTGVGKTHLAAAALRRVLLDRGVEARARWVYPPTLFRSVQATWRRDSPLTEAEVLAPVLDAEILVLDRLGDGLDREWAAERFLELLTEFYGRDEGVLLATSIHPMSHAREGETPLVERVAERAVSMLKEMCRSVEMRGHDFRDSVASHG